MLKHTIYWKTAILILLTLSTFSCAGTKATPESYAKRYTKLLEAIDKEDLDRLQKEFKEKFKGYSDLKELVDLIPHRLTGSEQGQKAEEFIFERLKSYGYNVRYIPFEIDQWFRKTATLSVSNGPNRWEPDTIQFSYSPEYTDATLPLVDVGDGLYEDFQSKRNELKNSIVLANLKIHDYERLIKKEMNPLRVDKTRFAINFGAKGIIFINSWDGQILTTGTVGEGKGAIAIPAFCITREDGRQLREQLISGQMVQVQIQATNKIEKIEARNIVGSLPGLELPNERVLIGAHLDSWDLAPAATDNGMGALAVLDIARGFAGAQILPRRTVEFVFWMGEEQGLLGSTAFMKKELKEGTAKNIRYYVNIDYMTNPIGFDIEGRPEMKDFFTEVGELVKSSGFEFQNKVDGRPTMATEFDTVPFVVQGIPTLQENYKMPGYIYQYYHSTKDLFPLVDKEHMRKSALAMGFALYRLSMAPGLPAKVLDSEATKKWLDSFGGTEILNARFLWHERKQIEQQLAQEKKKQEKKKPL